MANKFRTNLLILGGNTLSTTGSALYVNGVLVSGQGGISATSAQLYIGSGSPEGVVSAYSGSIYTDWFNRTLYQKISGSSTIGWV